MSFKPFAFTFTPPLTVPPPPLEAPSIISTGATVGGLTSGAQSKAGKLISRLNDLTDMSSYLQQAILNQTNKMGVEIDFAVDPNMSRALSSIFGTEAPPNIITIDTFNQLLDAHVGILQLDMATGLSSPVQPNPIQAADIMTAINTISGHLVTNASYNSWLPLQLNALKGDSVLFHSWADSLNTYPASYIDATTVSSTFLPNTISASGLDIDDALNDYENDAVNRFEQVYSRTYTAMATLNAVESDANAILSEYFVQPLQNIVRIISLFNALKGFAHKPNMANIQGDLLNYAFVRMAADLSGMLHTCDQLVALAVSPIKGALGSLSRIVSGVQQQAAFVGYLTHGGLAGLTKANACGQNSPANNTPGAASKLLVIPGLGTISEGLRTLGEKLDWAQNESSRSLAIVDKSFRQMLERRLGSHNDTQSLMCSIRALDGLIGLASGVAGEFKKGAVAQNSTKQQQQEAASRILTSLQTGTNTTFVSQDGTVIINPPNMPPVTPSVQRVLSNAKIRTTLGTIKS